MPTLPKVMLLGDSIRMSYEAQVADLLRGRAQVVSPAVNGQHTLYTLASLNQWFEELGEPDIVHWNNGLHDIGHNPVRYPVQFPLEMYVANLTFILERLLEVTPKVTWATMTPVHPDRPFVDTEYSWRNEEIDRNNAAARALMESRDVPVNDLHAVVWADRDAFLAEDQVHLSEAGEQACAQAVADAVARWL